MIYKKIAQILIILLPIIIFIGIRMNVLMDLSKQAVNYVDKLCINEVMADNLNGLKNEKGFYSDWIEIYNGTNSDVDLSQYYLSDSKNDLTKWNFPNLILKSKEYVIVYCDKYIDASAEYIHTSFSIDSENENIYLCDKNENIIDFVKLENQKTNVSYGRGGINNLEWGFFSFDTPKEENPPEFWQREKETKDWGDVKFSHNAGSYKNTFDLELSCDYKDAVILYTLDGSEPDFDSPIYSSKILIDENKSPNKYVNKKSIYFEDNYDTKYGVNNVYKGIVVRARILKDGVLSDTITTNSYFINPDYTLPIVSLVSDPYYLFDDKNGGYVVGSTYYTARKYGNYGSMANFEINQDFKGYIEIFDNGGNCSFEDNIEFSLSGGSSSQINIQKNFKVSLDSKEVPASYFGRDVNISYDSFYLRGSGGATFMGDMYMYPSAFITNSLQGVGVGAQASVPVIMFIDGEYWGIYTLMEPKGKEYISKNYNIPKADITIIEPYENITTEDFDLLIEEIFSKDMSNNENYEWLKQHINIQNYMQFVLAQGFYNNYDGLKKGDHNYIMWRDEREGSKYERWQWHLFDMDATMNDFDDFINDMLTFNFKGLDQKTRFSLCLFERLWRNESFRNEIYLLYCEEQKDIYNRENVIKQFENHVAVLEPEMQENIDRCERDYTNLKKSFYYIMQWDVEYENYTMEDWYKVEDYMLNFLDTRSEFFKECFVKHMNG